MKARMPVTTNRNAVTIRAPTSRPRPKPRALIFVLSSIDASSTSSRAIALAFSATSFAVVPRPGSSISVSGVRMAPPVDQLRDHDARNERSADDEERVRAATSLLLRAGELRLRRSARRAAPGGLVGRRLAPRPRGDQARLQLPQERCVVGQRLRELGGDASAGGRAVRDVAQAVRGAVDQLVTLVHFLAGGSSPVAMRYTREATTRAPIAA